MVNGNKFQKEVDLPALPGVLGLEIIRYYNSAYSRTATAAGPMGRGWRLSYETDITPVASALHLMQADGTRLIFQRTSAHANRYASFNSGNGLIQLRPTPRGNEYIWSWKNGRQLTFDTNGKLIQILAPTGEFLTLRRDYQGILTKVIDPQGRTLTLIYLDRKLAKPNDRFGGLQAIDSPVGRFTYHYGSERPKGLTGSTIDARYLLSNLVKVSLPTHYDASQKMHAYANRGITSSSISRLYHYEDARFPTLLTGITVSGQGSDGQLMNARVATWGYDEKGRAVLSVKGEPARFETTAEGTKKQVPGTGIEQVTLQFISPASTPHPGQTVLTNSLGQRTVYTHQTIAGDYRLMEVRGAGCASCGETNVRYRYDEQGGLRETTYLNEQGLPLRGLRTTLIATNAGIGTDIQTHKTERITYLNGKPQPAQPVLRQEYIVAETHAHEADKQIFTSNNPVLIAKPSVIPGKEHQLRITYNAVGQPTQIIETGWSPGLANALPFQISRAQTFTYRTINGRSLLHQVDGPLPNGPRADPGDSDITRYYYDDQGNRLVRLVHPLNTITTYKADAVTGRISDVINTQGQTTLYQYDSRGQLTQVSTSNSGHSQGMAVLHDAAGRITESIELVNGKRIPQTKAGFDAAGRLIWQANDLGVINRAHYDTESRLLSSTAQTSRFKQEEQYRYDDLGRLVGVTDSSGISNALTYNPLGQISGVIDPAGRLTHYSYSPTQVLAAVTQAANTPQAMTVAYGRNHLGQVDTVTANATPSLKGNHAVITRFIRDDFGREIAVISPDSGTISRGYDAANRLIKEHNALGDTFTYVYDIAGKLLRKTVTSLNALPVITTYRYQHNRLVEIAHPNQTEQYRYGIGGKEDGRLTTKITVLKLANGKTVPYATHYHYDETGSLAAQTLPDGSTLRYEKNGRGQIIALARDTNRFIPDQTLVNGIERDLIGLKRLTFGNGIQGEWQRSQEGILARVVYTRPANSSMASTSTHTKAQSFSPFGFIVSSAHAADAPVTPKPGALGIPANPNALWDARYLFDASGNMLHQSQHAQAAQLKTENYAYDALNQLIQAQASSTISRYWHDNLGNRLLGQENQPVDEMAATTEYRYQNGSHRSETGVFDAAGRPLSMGEKMYAWNAEGQLLAVTQKGKPQSTYRYNHRGERISKTVGTHTTYYLYDNRQRIAELDEHGQITRQYIWMADQLVAILDSPKGKPLMLRNTEQNENLWQVAAHWGQDAWSAIQRLFADDEAITYVHVNHLGAPVGATDNNGKAIWNADYAPFGKVAIKALNPFMLELRLPGQWEDAETGLYYNDYRYYDPNTGRYLSPDPLGIRGGLNPYGYVQANPLIYSDPLGLILFAFDGTGNSKNPGPSDSISNVEKFRDAYNSGSKFYITGIGTTDENMNYKGNIYDGKGFEQRVNLGFTFLNRYLENAKESTVDIDIVGFSRGAAEARVWANQLTRRMKNGAYTSPTGKSRCLNLRFIGVWDTVAHLGYFNGNESQHNFAIPKGFQFSAHAVAVNEHRGEPADFDVISILPFPGAKPAANRIERGFVGSHADIGGGYGTGDLSDVTLMWMIEQAKSQGIAFLEKRINDNQWNTVTNPLIHDKSGNRFFPRDPIDDDREFYYGNTEKVDQKLAPVHGLINKHAREFVNYLPTFCDTGVRPGDNPAVGSVDMAKYSNWLSKNYNVKIDYQGYAKPCQR